MTIASGLLLVQCLGLNLSAPLSWLTWALVLGAWLKRREARTAAELRLVALLQLVSTGLLAAQMQGLLTSVLQLLTVTVALAGLLQLGGVVSLPALLLRSARLLLAALPLALVLFLFVPRVAPLWTSDLGPRRGVVTGISPQMDPLGISRLARSDAPAARVTVAAGQELPRDTYWRVLVHGEFDGRRWSHQDPPPTARLQVLPSEAAEGSVQWWRIEPSRLRAVPWDGMAQPTALDQSITRDGELRLNAASRQPRRYRLRSGGVSGADSAWWLQPPRPRDRLLPTGQLPRLQELGASWRALPRDRDRLAAAESWFRRQSFRYTLEPGPTGDFDAFLFDRQEGFCGHYAGAFAALMRAADVPSRVVSGYVGGRRVEPLGGPPYLDLRQSDAHAWVEVWLNGQGWQRVDPTRWAAAGVLQSERRDGVTAVSGGAVPWWRWLQWQWWGLDLAWSRWWFGFDQTSQAAWLQALFGEQLRWVGVIAVTSAFGAVALGLKLFRAEWSFLVRDPLSRSLRLLARLGVTPDPGESFMALCHRAAADRPELAEPLLAMAEAQQCLVYADLSRRSRHMQQRRWRHCQREVECRMARRRLDHRRLMRPDPSVPSRFKPSE